MALNVIDWAWKHSKSKHGARLVLLAIADCANSEKGDGAWPSIKYLAKRANISVAAVHASLKTLVDLGELEIIYGGGAPTPYGPTNAYKVLMSDHPEEPVTQSDNASPGTGLESASHTEPVGVSNLEGSRIKTSAISAPVQDLPEGVQISGLPGLDSGPRTLKEPTTEPSTTKEGAAPFGAASNVTPISAGRDYDPMTSQGIVQAWLDACEAKGWGRPAPSRIGRAAKQLKEMLGAGMDPAVVRAGFAWWTVASPSRSPDAIPEFVQDAARGVLPVARAQNGSGRFVAGTGNAGPVEAVQSVADMHV